MTHRTRLRRSPRPSRPSCVEPTAQQLIEMARGSRKDWRTAPTSQELAVLDSTLMPQLEAELRSMGDEERAATAHYLRELDNLHTDEEAALIMGDWSNYAIVERRIHDIWDALGHLATGC